MTDTRTDIDRVADALDALDGYPSEAPQVALASSTAAPAPAASSDDTGGSGATPSHASGIDGVAAALDRLFPGFDDEEAAE